MLIWDPFYQTSEKISLKIEEKTLASIFLQKIFSR